jgi:hypothetical protein
MSMKLQRRARPRTQNPNGSERGEPMATKKETSRKPVATAKAPRGARAARPHAHRPAASPPGPVVSADSAARHRVAAEEIARRAYEIFLARGGEHGRDLEDWARAEAELLSEQ